MEKVEYLYHYTSVESLAMILSTKKFRLSPLSALDDLQEGKTSDLSTIGQTVFVSSWTAESKESIPMWNMYSDMKAGLRLKAKANLFDDCKITPDGAIIVSDYLHWKDDVITFPQELKQVIYSDNEDDLFPKIIDEQNNIWNQTKLGVYKNTAWEFQKEWRYIVRLWPGNKYDETDDCPEDIYKKFTTQIDKNIYLNIKSELLDSLEITLSPKISDGNRLIVKMLKEKFCPNMIIKNSVLQNCIR